MGDAGHQQADGGQALLPDHLTLQRLQLVTHRALLPHLGIQRLTRLPQAAHHRPERVLESLQEWRRHPLAPHGAEVPGRDTLSGLLQMVSGHEQLPDEPPQQRGPEGHEDDQEHERPRQAFGPGRGRQQPDDEINDRYGRKGNGQHDCRQPSVRPGPAAGPTLNRECHLPCVSAAGYRFTSGSATPAWANPAARSRQLSQRPQARPAGPGS